VPILGGAQQLDYGVAAEFNLANDGGKIKRCGVPGDIRFGTMLAAGAFGTVHEKAKDAVFRLLLYVHSWHLRKKDQLLLD
jgi:hypothetical protein